MVRCTITLLKQQSCKIFGGKTNIHSLKCSEPQYKPDKSEIFDLCVLVEFFIAFT